MYDFLIVGSGLFGSICARELADRGKNVLVIERRGHIGGNIYTENIEGIEVHFYGAHIFHTNNAEIWEYINRYATFNRFTNAVIANYHDEIFSLPFNMYTFNTMWGVVTPEQAKKIIEEQTKEIPGEPKNLEEQAIKMVGRDIYETLIRGYTEKQWGRSCSELPPSIIKRLPLRYAYDNNYYDADFQGIPTEGYTKIIERMLDGVQVELGTDYVKNKEKLERMAKKVIYTGAIDELYEYCLGELEYRSIIHEHEVLDMENYQGNAVVNYTAAEIPWTRIIEHKWFARPGASNKTVISKEFSRSWARGIEPYYPINDKANNELYKKYAVKAKSNRQYIFGGRLGTYRYMDMDMVIAEALKLVNSLV